MRLKCNSLADLLTGQAYSLVPNETHGSKKKLHGSLIAKDELKCQFFSGAIKKISVYVLSIKYSFIVWNREIRLIEMVLGHFVSRINLFYRRVSFGTPEYSKVTKMSDRYFRLQCNLSQWDT